MNVDRWAEAAIIVSGVGFLIGFAGALRVNRYAMVAGAGLALAGGVLAFVAGFF